MRPTPYVMSDTNDVPTVKPDRFRPPPVRFTDEAGRDLEIRREVDDYDGLVEMYDAYDPRDRAQGIPPRTPERIRSWVKMLLEDGENVIAWHDGRAVGHATLVPAGDGIHELAIFVASGYQRSGIGSHLIRALLAHGAERGVERIWLTVERSNEVALRLYRSTGFAVTREGVEREMELELEPTD